MATAQAQGAAAEAAAAEFLAARGLALVESNFRVRGGEIDLICRDGATIVFVEVRLRRRSDYGGAGASITTAKQARIVMAARHWLARHRRHDPSCRFDCVLIDGDRLEWLTNAFSAD
ncbi:MAG: YraN family protein [Rhodocyclaceae bacterium]|nr:YraN family protein [Rhodocyclaceae bacterium]